VQVFDGVEMALVPAGCFMMGSEGGPTPERPSHEQCFEEPFWIDRYEVTNGQYGSTDLVPENTLPKTDVGWFEAQAHCESRGARLPTEAEWEYAARGPDGLAYPWGDSYLAGNIVLYGNMSHWPNEPAPVGSKPEGASWVMAQDLSGNAFEWVHSISTDYPYHPDDGREIDGSGDDTSLRVVRGGVVPAGDEFATQSTRRFAAYPDDPPWFVGFRCARDYAGE
jgi:iron(II)-dependent oxidoreductase